MSDEPEPVYEDLGYGALPPEYATPEETPGLHRRREAHHANPPTWKRPNVVETVPCMVPSCRKPVEVTDEAMTALIVFSKHLRSRGEEPLDMAKTFNCETCRVEREADWEDRQIVRRERTTRSIRMLKGVEPASPADEREAMKWLEKVMGKGYLVDLLRCIEDKKNGGGKKTRTREHDL